jgi:hypothetical protein
MDYDNLKVQLTESPYGIYTLCLRWLRRGVTCSAIQKAFKTALEKQHGLCVDFQLLRGDPHLRFHIGSTITKCDRILCEKWWKNELNHWSDSVVVVA